jgi:regulator of sigma D
MEVSMDWTIEINDGYLLERQQFVFENTEIKRIEPIEEIKEVYSLSPFCQFFLRSVATGYLNLYASFPIPDKNHMIFF